MAYFLGIDIGGSVIKSGLYDEFGHEKSVCALNDPTLTPQSGFSERNMDQMWQNVCASIRAVISQAPIGADEILGVSFSAHGKGLYAIDKAGCPVRHGIVSSDNRAIGIAQMLKADGVEAAARPYAYQQVWSMQPACLLRWLKEHEPDNYHRVDRILMAHDFIRYRLTGDAAAEITNMSGSHLFNLEKRAYEPALFDLFGIPEMEKCTAPVIGSTETRAGISQSASESTGLLPNTPVFGGFFDVVSSAVCAGLSHSDAVNVVMGTWTIETWVSDHIPRTDYPYIWSHYCIPGTYFVHEGSPTSASNLAWFLKTFLPNEEKPYARCEALLKSLPKAESSLQFLPYLFASNLGDTLSSGFYGMNSAHDLAQIVQAVFEGISFAQQVHLDRILALSGDKPLRLTGGPSRSRAWMQMVSDLSGLPVEAVTIQESGCLGAAIAAAVGSGIYPDFATAMQFMCPSAELIEPDRAARAAYLEKYARFKTLAGQLAPLGF